MTRRRLRLPELVALLAVTAPVLADQPGSASSTPSVGDSARQLGQSVKRSSAELGQRVANDAHVAGQKLSAGMTQAGQSMHRWWDGVRSPGAHPPAGSPSTNVPQSASLQSTSSFGAPTDLGSPTGLGGPTGSAKSQSSTKATGQSWP
jgi:hypothetical protein